LKKGRKEKEEEGRKEGEEGRKYNQKNERERK
jgi:hypothetical protein